MIWETELTPVKPPPFVAVIERLDEEIIGLVDRVATVKLPPLVVAFEGVVEEIMGFVDGDVAVKLPPFAADAVTVGIFETVIELVDVVKLPLLVAVTDGLVEVIIGLAGGVAVSVDVKFFEPLKIGWAMSWSFVGSLTLQLTSNVKNSKAM